MAQEVILNSNTYTDGTSDEGVGKKYLANDGHRTNFIPLFTDMLVEQTAVATNASNAATSETNAATSETNAALSATKLTGTSTTSLLIESTSKVFITQTSKFFEVGRWLLITSDANTSNYMAGQVTVYSGTSLTVNITNIGGSGTFADWTITVAGVSGVDGSLLDWTADQGVQNIHPNNYDTSNIDSLITRNSNNISLLHFYRASDHALSVQDFIDGFMDEYEDETGVDTATSTNERHDADASVYTNAYIHGDILNASLTFDGAYDVSGQETTPEGVFIGDSGTKMYVVGQTGDDVNQYTLTTAWDVLGTVTFNGAYDVSGQESFPTGLAFNSDGTKMYVVGTTGVDVNQYTLTTAWDVLGTVTFNGAYDVSGQDNQPRGIFFGNGDNNMYIAGWQGDDINQYTIAYGLIMTLYSNAFTALSQPDSANIVVYEDDVDPVTINTDLIASVSRDGGTTYSTVTLSLVGQNIYAGEVDISGQPAGTSVKYKLLTTTAEMKIHGVSVQWA